MSELTPRAVSPRDAARLIGVSKSSVYRLIQSGELKAHKVGHRTVVLLTEIDALLARAPEVVLAGSAVAQRI